ncbi:hypothetical protein J6590_073887 [Homalodisca vitripennis]|nr:hypothetical protein J6590_073887 [Homalodisca vitripennis]
MQAATSLTAPLAASKGTGARGRFTFYTQPEHSQPSLALSARVLVFVIVVFACFVGFRDINFDFIN